MTSSSKWQPVVLDDGRRTIYREDEFGNQQIHVNDKNTGISLTEATLKDVHFMVNVIFNSTMKEKLKTDIFKNRQLISREAATRTVQNKLQGLEDDSTNLFFIIKNNKNRIGFCEIIGGNECSSYAEVQFAFYDEKKRRIYQDKVVKTLNMVCKKYSLFDLLFFYIKERQTIKIIYKHPSIPNGIIYRIDE